MTRVIIYDTTDATLSPVWALGARLYRRLGWCDEISGAPTMAEAMISIRARHARASVDEIQIWSHGSPGRLWWGRKALPPDVLAGYLLGTLRPGGLLWLRICAYVCGAPGRQAVHHLGRHLGATVAAHTHDIGHYGLHSGLRVYHPDDSRMDWPAEEGIVEGTIARPTRTAPSRPWHPSTITALTHRLPRR